MQKFSTHNTHNKYLAGITWSLVVCIISATNDLFTKISGISIPAIEIVFFRFFFSLLTLLPFAFIGKKISFKSNFETKHVKIHSIRSFLLALAISSWAYGVIELPLYIVTIISFSTPLFVLLFSNIFLKEDVSRKRIFFTITGFAGVILSIEFCTKEISLIGIFCMILSTIIFASLDIINKKLIIKKEQTFQMIFFSNLGTVIFCLFALPFVWITPNFHEIINLFFLGLGANAILFCLLKSFKYVDLSAIQPVRYFEFFVSSLFGVMFFNDLPSINVIIGFALVMISNVCSMFNEVKRK